MTYRLSDVPRLVAARRWFRTQDSTMRGNGEVGVGYMVHSYQMPLCVYVTLESERVLYLVDYKDCPSRTTKRHWGLVINTLRSNRLVDTEYTLSRDQLETLISDLREREIERGVAALEAEE